MKSSKKLHKRLILFGWMIVIIIGICFPSFSPRMALGEGEDDGSGNSGGFLIEADKVEGTIDVMKILSQGEADIGEGKIYGLTITKKLETADKGTLVIKIKSQGPIDVENLKGKLMGMPGLGGVCIPSQPDWVCMTGVKMTLSEQTADAISLPNATVETCFDGQCEDARLESKSQTSGKTLDEIEKEMPLLKEQLDQVKARIQKAKALAETAANEKQTALLQQLLKEAQAAADSPNELEPLAKQIGERYNGLNQSASAWGAALEEADQWLKQIMVTIEQDENAFSSFTGQKPGSDAKKTGQNKQTTDIAPPLKNLEQRLKEIQDEAKSLQGEIKALQTQRQSFMDRLAGFKRDIDELQRDINQNKDQYSEEQLKQILQFLAVGSSDEGTASAPSGHSADESGGASDSHRTNSGGENDGKEQTGHPGQGDQARLEQQLEAMIQNGEKQAASIQPTLDEAKVEINQMEQLADDLSERHLFILNTLNAKKADQFEAVLDAFQKDVAGLTEPVKGLKATLSKAEALQNKLGKENKDLQELQAVFSQIEALKKRLKDGVKKKLEALPYFERVHDFIERMDKILEEWDSW
ncbi:hypothetical protein [Caenibacillus caldisaponilyticus]|uniref:hypothetical protein n=1 Tax=Caenibacillus caldisaponilyticus TaxID=1674942 RepID=UPI0009883336|nr:hypothetical protein [Caenibacillus caldisaponilyticus]